MKKTILAITLLSLVLAVSFASAYGGWGHGTHHEEMEEVMEEGTYQDLVEHRNEMGWNMMPWVDSEEEFQQIQERHEQMEEYHGQHGYGRMGGCHGAHDHRGEH